jgi:hypothetical protein
MGMERKECPTIPKTVAPSLAPHLDCPDLFKTLLESSRGWGRMFVASIIKYPALLDATYVFRGLVDPLIRTQSYDKPAGRTLTATTIVSLVLREHTTNQRGMYESHTLDEVGKKSGRSSMYRFENKLMSTEKKTNQESHKLPQQFTSTQNLRLAVKKCSTSSRAHRFPSSKPSSVSTTLSARLQAHMPPSRRFTL